MRVVFQTFHGVNCADGYSQNFVSLWIRSSFGRRDALHTENTRTRWRLGVAWWRRVAGSLRTNGYTRVVALSSAWASACALMAVRPETDSNSPISNASARRERTRGWAPGWCSRWWIRVTRPLGCAKAFHAGREPWTVIVFAISKSNAA